MPCLQVSLPPHYACIVLWKWFIHTSSSSISCTMCIHEIEERIVSCTVVYFTEEHSCEQKSEIVI